MENKYAAIGGSVMGLIIIALLALYIPGLTDNTYFCEKENKLLECDYGISGGLGTRCYLDENKTSWDYCSTGWLKVSDYVEVNQTNETETQEVIVTANGEDYSCIFEETIKSPYVVCESPTGKQAYIGELIHQK